MGITEKDTLKTWFETGDFPTQEQFWHFMDSYWHKLEKIPINAIDDTMINRREPLRGSVINFKGTSVLYKTIPFNVKVLTISGKNYQINKSVLLELRVPSIIRVAFHPKFRIVSGQLATKATNYIQLLCINDTPDAEKVLVKIFQ